MTNTSNLGNYSIVCSLLQMAKNEQLFALCLTNGEKTSGVATENLIIAMNKTAQQWNLYIGSVTL